MDYVKIMEELLNLVDSNEEKVADAKIQASFIAAKAEDLLQFFQSKNDREILEKITCDKTEICEKLVAFIMPLLYLCHDTSLSGDSMEAMLYSEIVKECNKKVNNPAPKITAL